MHVQTTYRDHHNIYGENHMKRITSIVIAALILLGGVFAAPAQAADPTTPPECEQSVQEWRTQSEFWEGKFLAMQDYYRLTSEALKAEQATATGLRTDVANLRGTVATQTTTISELRADVTAIDLEAAAWEKRAERRHEKIQALRKLVRQLRNR